MNTTQTHPHTGRIWFQVYGRATQFGNMSSAHNEARSQRISGLASVIQITEMWEHASADRRSTDMPLVVRTNVGEQGVMAK